MQLCMTFFIITSILEGQFMLPGVRNLTGQCLQAGFELQMIVLSVCCQKLNILDVFSKAHINMLFSCLFRQLCYVNVQACSNFACSSGRMFHCSVIVFALQGRQPSSRGYLPSLFSFTFWEAKQRVDRAGIPRGGCAVAGH